MWSVFSIQLSSWKVKPLPFLYTELQEPARSMQAKAWPSSKALDPQDPPPAGGSARPGLPGARAEEAEEGFGILLIPTRARLQSPGPSLALQPSRAASLEKADRLGDPPVDGEKQGRKSAPKPAKLLGGGGRGGRVGAVTPRPRTGRSPSEPGSWERRLRCQLIFQQTKAFERVSPRCFPASKFEEGDALFA